jgi:hypothetical protein
MARPLRIGFAGALYHVTARDNERKPVYRNDRDRTRFLDRLAAARRNAPRATPEDFQLAIGLAATGRRSATTFSVVDIGTR